MTRSEYLTKTRALIVLQPRLRFGDPQQIEALHWLQVAESLKGCQVEGECTECQGFGHVVKDFDDGELRTVQQLRDLVREVEERNS